MHVSALKRPHLIKNVLKQKTIISTTFGKKKGEVGLPHILILEKFRQIPIITFSIDIKRINIEGVAQARLYTTRLSDGNWGTGNDCSETGVFIDLKDGWKREFHTIKTKDYSDILLSGWMVTWDYGPASGHLYVRNPRLEIGDSIREISKSSNAREVFSNKLLHHGTTLWSGILALYVLYHIGTLACHETGALYGCISETQRIGG